MIWSPARERPALGGDQITFKMKIYRAAMKRLVIRSLVVSVAVVLIARVAVRGWTDAQLT